MPDTLTAPEIRPDFGVAVAASGPTRVQGLAVPWETASKPFPDGVREMLARGSVLAESLIGLPLLWRHDTIIGRIAQAWNADLGIMVEAEFSDPASVLAQQILDAANKWRDENTVLGFSPGYDPAPAGVVNGVRRRTAADVREITITPVPSFGNARVTRALEQGGLMTDTDTKPKAPDAKATETKATETKATETKAQDNPTEPVHAVNVANAAIEAKINDVMAKVNRLSNGSHDLKISPLARFNSFGDYLVKAMHDPQVQAAWVDQITTNNPGVMQPTWFSDVKGIIDGGRPFIQALGGPADAGDSGMELNFPYFDGDLSAIFAKQLVEKTEINSVRVDIKKGSVALLTFAAGSDISMQLIERSAPSYIDAYFRILYAAFSLTTDTAAIFAAETAGTGSVTYAPGTPGSIHQAVVDAALKVKRATGQPPSIVTIREASWAGVAGAVDSDGRPLYPPYNPVNSSGTATQDGALMIRIAGIPAIPMIGQTTPLVVTNGIATRWHEDGPREIRNDVAMKLGRDVGVYAYANQAIYAAKGIVKLTQALAAAADATPETPETAETDPEAIEAGAAPAARKAAPPRRSSAKR